MTIKKIFKKYSNIEIELLLAHVLKKPKEFLYLAPERKLSSYQVKSLSSMVKRRLNGEPVAYILGYKDFMGLRFKVNRNVLIPRPETEEMVEKVVSEQRLVSSKKPVKILDVGTGSGCIAVSLARQFQILDIKFQIIASDISKAALKVAKQNAKAHKVKARFVLSDLLNNFKGKFDILIANLPYVPATDYAKLKSGLKYEPKNAIFVKENGLRIIKKFLKQLSQSKILNPESKIYLEFDPRQKAELHKLVKKFFPGWKVIFYKDFGNLWRFVEIKNPPA